MDLSELKALETQNKKQVQEAKKKQRKLQTPKVVKATHSPSVDTEAVRKKLIHILAVKARDLAFLTNILKLSDSLLVKELEEASILR